jgi:hypothetical protein
VQTVIVRIEEPPSEGGDFTVRGLSVPSPGAGEVEQAVGRIPATLPAIAGNGQQLDTPAAIHDMLVTNGDPQVSPDQVGRYLWRLLAETPVGAWWQRTVDATPDTVRTLLDVQAAALRPLPWELLTREPDGHRPFLSPSKPWARASGPEHDTDDLVVPVRMLVVVGDPEDPNLRVADEFDVIVGALREVPGRWHVELLTKPSSKTLREVLEDFRPHVLHVITHGAVEEESGSVVLVMPLEGGGSWELTTSDIADLLSQPPRLVVLNACRSGSLGTDPPVPWTFTDAFLRHGCGAVVTMQGNIPSRAAIPFSAAFYREVALGSGVDVAAARGRQAAYDELKEDRGDQRSWALPSLYLATPPERVLPVRLAVTTNPVQQPPYRDAYEPVGTYVDRTEERWKLLTAVDPIAGPPRENLVVVAGAAKVGKSAVVRSALLTCHLRGRQVVYVDLDRRAGARWLAALRYVRDELTRWLSDAVEPMRRFDHELAFLKERRPPAEYDPGSARQDDGGDFDFGSEDFIFWTHAIFASFRTALQATARTGPLLLALDHLYKIYQPDVGDFMVPGLLAPIGGRELPKVQLVIVGRNEWLDELRSTDPSLVLPPPIRVPMFSWRKIEGLGREYVARQNRLPVNDRVIRILREMQENQPPEFTGDKLQTTLSAIGYVA